jgi:NADH-quinone oxidoreductase subunit N
MTFAELVRQSQSIRPELMLSVLICVVLAADMFVPKRFSRPMCNFLSLAGTTVTLIVTVFLAGNTSGASSSFFGSVVQDQLAGFLKIVFLLGAGITFFFSLHSREMEGYRHGEFCSLVLGATLGACFLVSADNLVMFLLGLETLSLCSYVLAGFIKHERPSSEAALKYMIYGSVASGVMLFGLSYLYGLTGTLTISQGVRSLMVLESTGVRLSGLLVILLILAGLGFKIAMVPFHFWCPDVYQGSPTPVTAFLSVVSKAAGFGALLRILLPFFTMPPSIAGAGARDLSVLFGVLSLVTMTFGNLVAIRQKDVKRLLAYSSIAHAGYMLMALTVHSQAALESVYFYLFVYLFMNLGAFWVVIVLINRLGGAEIERFRGAAAKAPFLFAALFVFLISLTGIPPTAGFVGKFMLFKVVIGAGLDHMQNGGMTPGAVFYFALALVGVLNSAISLFYYMRIARTMVFDKATDETPLGDDLADRLGAALFAVPCLALLYFAPVLDLIQWTAR